MFSNTYLKNNSPYNKGKNDTAVIFSMEKRGKKIFMYSNTYRAIEMGDLSDKTSQPHKTDNRLYYITEF